LFFRAAPDAMLTPLPNPSPFWSGTELAALRAAPMPCRRFMECHAFKTRPWRLSGGNDYWGL